MTEHDDIPEDMDADLSEEEIRRYSGELHETQELYEKLAFLSLPKMPCPECGGKGANFGGSLGDYCPGCDGSGYVAHPGAEDVDMPDFASMRRRLTAYGDALADRLLPPTQVCTRCRSGKDAQGMPCRFCGGTGERDNPGKRNLALPPARDIREQAVAVREMKTAAREESKKLLAAQGQQQVALPPKARNQLAGGTVEGGFGAPSDADLDAMEEDANARGDE